MSAQTETTRSDSQALAVSSPERFQQFVSSAHPVTVMDAVSHLEPESIAPLLRAISPEKRAEIFGHLKQDLQKALAGIFQRTELATVLEFMNADERADFFRALDEDTREEVFPLMARAEREDLRKLGSYKEGTAGSLMTSDYATLLPELTAREALEKLRHEAPDKETIYSAYVVDDHRRIIGVMSLQELIVALPTKKIADIMRRDVISASVDESREEVARRFAKYDLIAMPITNGGNSLVGIVTVDDVLDVTEEEATTDFHRMGSSAPLGVSFKEAPLLLLFKKRIPWLLVLVFMNILSGAGIAYFEDTISAAVALVFFLPLLIGSGGNAGSQSATLMVRALATGDVKNRDWLHLLGREFTVALLMGGAMALAVYWLGHFRAGDKVALVVAITMVIVVMVGSLIGMSLPFVFTKLKMDPATASAPLVTSLADIAGVLIYFSVATWYLGLG